jgi:hypothetical protein
MDSSALEQKKAEPRKPTVKPLAAANEFTAFESSSFDAHNLFWDG